MNIDLTTEAFQAHGRFVQELAHALLRDPHAADEVVQETWLRWFRLGAAGVREPRGWLARVVRYQASNFRRASERRARYEQQAASKDAPRSPADETENAELIHRLVDAVFALEEPYRGTILARYLRGHSARELARERGESLATVRSRERRALELLRARLDRNLGGRQAWAAVLASWIGPATTRACRCLLQGVSELPLRRLRSWCGFDSCWRPKLLGLYL